MHICHAALISTLTLAPVMLSSQPSPPAVPATEQPSAPAPAPASTLLQPALHDVEGTLNSLKFDKWKKGSVRDEAASNANAILSDLKAKMPPLLSETDASNGAISQTVPLVKHVDALYDVLLRVEEASRVSAPGDQIDQLEATLRKFESARIALYDSMQQRAAGQEKQVTDLQATIKTQKDAIEQEKKAPPPPAPQPCTPPKPAVKKKRPAAKPAQPANGQPAQPANGQPAQKPAQNPPAQKPQQ